MYELHNGDCLDIMRGMDANSVDLIVTDPPYFKVKGDWWDRQWDTPQGFLAWMAELCAEWQRLLKPNGSLYVFASPRMAARVEVTIAERFNVLNRIRWVKEAGWHLKAEKEALRSYLSPYEEIVFAEKDTEWIRAYLESERQRAGVSKEDINEALGFRRMGGMAGRHYFSQSQWQLPTPEHYEKMRGAMGRLNHGGEYLRREYEDLRRPFSVSADVPYTDVWTFPTVAHYPGKHPCEKPLAMLRHILTASSRPGAVVMDCFMGSGVTGKACRELGRDFIGMEIDAHWYAVAEQGMATAQPALLVAAE